MTVSFEQIIKESTKSLAVNEEFKKMVIHNLGNYLQIQSSYKICKENFFDLDFRTDYWWKPEIRLLGKYYIDYFKNDFYPPEELRHQLFEAFAAAKTAREKGVFDFVPKNTAFYDPDLFKKIGQELAKTIRNSSFDSKVLRDSRPKLFKEYTSVSDQMAAFAADFHSENVDSEMNGTLIHRFQFMPYYLARTEEELKKATFFMSAFYTLFTATNAYQTGAAQNFGPILGNNSSKQFLEIVTRWFSGESISKTGFIVHDSNSEEPADKSEYVAVLELFGFVRLHEVPYVNKVVMKNYRKIFDLHDGHGKSVQENVGTKVRKFLEQNSSLIPDLADSWDKHLSSAKKNFALHFEPERIQKARQREQHSEALLNAPLLLEYEKQIADVGVNLSAIEKAQALVHLCLDANAYLEASAEEDVDGQSNEVTAPINYWSIAPGEGAQFWQEWVKSGHMTIGWDDLGDLKEYKTQDEIKERYVDLYAPESDPVNNTKTLFDFASVLKKGDVVFVKDGISQLVGIGTVTSDYKYQNRKVHRHVRKVNWTNTGEWDLPDNEKFAVKTLTNITPYPDFVSKLFKLAGILSKDPTKADTMKTKAALPDSKNLIYWGPPGTGKTYQLLKMQELFIDSSPNSKDQLVTWIQELGWWDVVAAAMIDLNRPVSVPELFQHEFVQIKTKQSANKTPKNTLWGMLQTHTVNTSKTVNFERRQEPLVVDKSDDSKWSLVGDWENQLEDLAKGVKQIRSGSGGSIDRRFKVVTFHQSYSYEEFVEGIRPERLPDGSGVSYQVKDGVFKLLCQRAIENPEKNYALFIDEINRGNISKIFGELITLIEKDKRLGAEHEVTITLPYSGAEFGVPQNLFIIGTMNSVDRSIALVDMALRRRFEFVSVRPDPELVASSMVTGINLRKIFEKLNQKISVILGSEYQIGHSYFMGERTVSLSMFKKTWFGGILPLLQEYLFDDWEKLEALVGGFVQSTEVKDLEKLSLPRFSFGTFIDDRISDEKFSELLKKLE